MTQPIISSDVRRLPAWAIAPVIALLLFIASGSSATADATWNIAAFGAEPRSDVTEILQQGLATQHEHGLPVFIPGHVYYVSDTITIPQRAGAALAGVATGRLLADDSPFQGSASQLVWVGPADQPMFVIHGTELRIAGGLTLVGKPRAEGNERCQVGIRVTKPGIGLGTGKIDCDWLMLQSFKTGIEFGSTPGEHNCDEMSVDRLTLRNCEVGYRLVNSQSMGHRIGHVYAISTPVVFDVRGGGMLSVDSSLLFGGTLLRLRANDPAKFSPGSNNASFRLDEVKIDANAKGQCLLVDMADPLRVDISSTGGRVSGNNGGLLAIMRGESSLVLRDWTNIHGESIKLQHRKINGKRAQPHVLLNHCRLACDPDEIIHPDSSTAGTVILRDCFDGLARPVDLEQDNESKPEANDSE